MEDNINHPVHYTEGFANRPIECIDITRHLPFTFGNAVKYIWRAGKKGDRETALQDLGKAEWYIEDWRDFHGDKAIPEGVDTASAIFDLLTDPDDGSLEGLRYDALESLLRCKIDWDDVSYFLQKMRKEIQNGQK